MKKDAAGVWCLLELFRDCKSQVCLASQYKIPYLPSIIGSRGQRGSDKTQLVPEKLKWDDWEEHPSRFVDWAFPVKPVITPHLPAANA